MIHAAVWYTPTLKSAAGRKSYHSRHQADAADGPGANQRIAPGKARYKCQPLQRAGGPAGIVLVQTMITLTIKLRLSYRQTQALLILLMLLIG